MFEDYVVAPQALIDVDVVAYQSTVIPEAVQIAAARAARPRAGDGPSASRGGDGSEHARGGLLAACAAWAHTPEADERSGVRVHAVPADGRLRLAWDYPEPHTVICATGSADPGYPSVRSGACMSRRAVP